MQSLAPQAECLETGSLFEDDTFGPEYNEEWRRPQDICDDLCLFEEGSSRFDVVQVSPESNSPPPPQMLGMPQLFSMNRENLEIAGLSPPSPRWPSCLYISTK